jgi:hypothetical protein
MITTNNMFKVVLLLLVLSGCASQPAVYRAPPPQRIYATPVTTPAPVYTPVAPRVQPSISIVSQPTFEKPILQVAVTPGYLESDLTHVAVTTKFVSQAKIVQCESLSLCTINVSEVFDYKQGARHTNIYLDISLMGRASPLKSFPIQFNTSQFTRQALEILGDSVATFNTADARQPTGLREKGGIYQIIGRNGDYVQICTLGGRQSWVRTSIGNKIFAAKPSIISGCR